jgi:hypothetical protein
VQLPNEISFDKPLARNKLPSVYTMADGLEYGVDCI